MAYSPTASWSIGTVASTGEGCESPNMLVLVAMLYRLVSVLLVLTSLIKLVLSSNFQSLKYPGLEVIVLTSASPESIATARDIDGLSIGDAWLHKRPTPIARFTSSSLYSDNFESTSSISRSFSCRCQA